MISTSWAQPWYRPDSIINQNDISQTVNQLLPVRLSVQFRTYYHVGDASLSRDLTHSVYPSPDSRHLSFGFQFCLIDPCIPAVFCIDFPVSDALIYFASLGSLVMIRPPKATTFPLRLWMGNMTLALKSHMDYDLFYFNQAGFFQEYLSDILLSELLCKVSNPSVRNPAENLLLSLVSKSSVPEIRKVLPSVLLLTQEDFLIVLRGILHRDKQAVFEWSLFLYSWFLPDIQPFWLQFVFTARYLRASG